MNSEIKGKRFAVAGAASALGSAIVARLDEEGAAMLLLGRNAEKLDAVLAATRAPQRHSSATIDLEDDPDAVAAVITQDAQTNGPLAGGVYCPGVEPVMPLRGLNTNMIERAFRVNYVGAQMFTKGLASKKARDPQGGGIVLIASVAGLRGSKGISTYCAAKAALIASARSLALELAPLRIRVNSISPGWFESAMAEASFSWYPGGKEKVAEAHPLGMGKPHDVAAAAVFLLSTEAGWITGSNMVVDGGYLA